MLCALRVNVASIAEKLHGKRQVDPVACLADDDPRCLRAPRDGTIRKPVGLAFIFANLGLPTGRQLA
eukprot:6172304-Pleurochrysis_carterae.AAC.3